MGRILHLELSTGASGDKLLGALLEVCEATGTAGFEDLERVGHALVPHVSITRTCVRRGGIAATHLVIEEPHPPMRHWSEIRDMIKRSAAAGALPPAAAERALAAFELVAHAEASVHNQPPDHVHFHELGAADSILDIVGSCFLLEALSPQAVYATSLALGSGTFTCEHGVLPVPAPATAHIIKGLPVYSGAFEEELTTPSGAALVRSFVTRFAPLPHVRVCAVGYGAGSRDITGAANVVRVLAGDADDAALLEHARDNDELTYAGDAAEFRCAENSEKDTLALEGCTLVESNIDHRSPEALAFICDELLRRGALDVWQEPITMKKGRLAVKLCLLCTSVDAPRLAKQLITSTGTLGVRMRYVERIISPRAHVNLETPYGPVPYKTACIAYPDEPIEGLVRPEHDAVSTLAREHGLDYQTLYEELVSHAQSVCFPDATSAGGIANND